MARATFWIQTDALLRKNLTFQKRNKCSSITIILVPIIICVLLSVFEAFINTHLKLTCGCNPSNTKECGIRYSDNEQAGLCAAPHPTLWPGLLQVPLPQDRAVRAKFLPSVDLPDASCRNNGSCPVSILLTGNNRSLAESVGENMLTTAPSNTSDLLASMANNVIGSATLPSTNMVYDSAFTPGEVLYHVQKECTTSSNVPVSIAIGDMISEVEVTCVRGQFLWCNSSSEINTELYRGDAEGNSEGKTYDFVAAYDFLNSNGKNFNVSIWYKAAHDESSFDTAPSMGVPLTRVSRLVNLVSNAYLQFSQKAGTKIQFEFVKEMPKQQFEYSNDISAVFGVSLFTFIIIGLFPPVLTLLVYENQNRLRMMMKMHGLGDGPYWLMTYSYFLALSSIYMFCFIVVGSLTGLKIITFNDYSLQFVFYFLYINLQISIAFLLAPFFSNVSTARVTSYIIIIGSGLLGLTLFQRLLEMPSFRRNWIVVMELFPGFSLYRGLYELGAYVTAGVNGGFRGMKWENLNDSTNGMKAVLLIMFVEWLIVLPIAYYIDRAIISGRSATKCSLSCLTNLWKKFLPSRKPSLQELGSGTSIQMEKPDVIQEGEKVEQLLQEGSVNETIIADNLAKVYPARDGNPPKAAVKGVSLALPRGECFGMLGPNGAGKTSFISMMIGLSKPTSGRAFVDGKDILTQMNDIYSNMGVCPQHDLLWESLTGREHLLFYGRLKNLTGRALKQAVEESLESVNLYHGGIGDKFVGKYSGGMKRRLSVAISLIGDSKVVYMDEPSTGLDPASRNNLWEVVRRAKQDRAIVLTTHSMEEAEVLCDRLGIFVDGSLHCIGHPQELKARYGGSFVFTITTASIHEEEVERMVRRLSPSAQRIYQISGTQKFELPKQEVRIADVFEAVQEAKNRFGVNAWGLADTTLEDVFIKVARSAQAFNTLDS